MRPLLLQGHERSITRIRYNREGDLLFSCAKDATPNVWYSLNGERLGTFNGHSGAVWDLDVDWESRHLITGAADNSLRIWDCSTGKLVGKLETKSAVRTCAYSYSGNMATYTTDKAMGNLCEIFLIDVREADTIGESDPILRIPIDESKVTSILFGTLDEFLITGHENGDLCQWDLKTGKKIKVVSEHGKGISDAQFNKDSTMFITASRDTTAKLFDTESLECMKTYKTERPVNSASISPKFDHVVLGGGQEAMDVTTTSTKIGKFDSRFFHLVFEEEFARLKGHFGPINSLAFHPDGDSYTSGGEDGYIRVHTFDKAYYDFNRSFFGDYM